MCVRTIQIKKIMRHRYWQYRFIFKQLLFLWTVFTKYVTKIKYAWNKDVQGQYTKPYTYLLNCFLNSSVQHFQNAIEMFMEKIYRYSYPFNAMCIEFYLMRIVIHRLPCKIPDTVSHFVLSMFHRPIDDVNAICDLL